MPIFSAVGLAIGGSSAKATGRSRSNFAVHHLRAAAQAARDAHEVERANPPVYGPWFEEMVRLVPVSIVMAAAAIEANANEIVKDILDDGKLAAVQITNGQRLLVRELKKDRSTNSMKKHRTLALLFDKDDPDTGSTVWQAAKHLTEFRNRLLHFKPAWTDETDVHESELAEWLKKRAVPIAPGDQHPNSFRFPDGFMTYGCAKWSVQTVLDFSKSYAAILGVPDRFAANPYDYALP